MSAKADAYRFLGTLLDYVASGDVPVHVADSISIEFAGFCDEWAGVNVWKDIPVAAGVELEEDQSPPVVVVEVRIRTSDQ